jgi:hypothetical protein
MNITQVYLTPDYDTTQDRDLIGRYQNETTYIQLFIEECLRKNKVDLGAFNRLIFSEGGDLSEDFKVVGNNALPVAIEKTYSELLKFKTELEFHNYFVRKFLEGFDKLDKHYKSSFKKYLKPLIADKFNGNLQYDKKIATKRIEGYRLQVIGRYTRAKFTLNVLVFNKNKMVNSKAIFECEPDMFIVKYHAYKVVVDESSIVVLNKIREKTLEHKVEEFI